MTLADYQVLSAQYFELTKWPRRRQWIFWIIIALLAALIGFAIYLGDTWLIALMVLYLGIALATRYVVTPWAVRRRFRQQRLDDNSIMLTVTSDMIVVENVRHRSELKPAAIERVDRMATHTILWLNLMQGIAVPDRAFANATTAQAFAAYAEHFAMAPLKESTDGETT